MSKRRSLPADLHLPQGYVKFSEEQKPLTRASRRQSMSEIGFGRMETYTKLDKLGQVSNMNCLTGISAIPQNTLGYKKKRRKAEHSYLKHLHLWPAPERDFKRIMLGKIALLACKCFAFISYIKAGSVLIWEKVHFFHVISIPLTKLKMYCSMLVSLIARSSMSSTELTTAPKLSRIVPTTMKLPWTSSSWFFCALSGHFAVTSSISEGSFALSLEPFTKA